MMNVIPWIKPCTTAFSVNEGGNTSGAGRPPVAFLELSIPGGTEYAFSKQPLAEKNTTQGKIEIWLAGKGPEDVRELTTLVLRSKSFLGYDKVQMQYSRRKLILQVKEKYLSDPHGRFVVAKIGLKTVGMACLALPRSEENKTKKQGYLAYLYVAPELIKSSCGVGSFLFEHVVNMAKELGLNSFTLGSEPLAVGFYRKQGCVEERTVRAWIPGQPKRTAQVMRYTIRQIGGEANGA